MKYTIESVGIWYGPVEDKPGGLAEKLEALSEAGIALEFVDANRGSGLLFVSPVKGAKQIHAARKAGLEKADIMQAICVTGPDAAGLGARACRALGDAGISFRALSAISTGRKSRLYFALDSKADAVKAKRLFASQLK